MPPFSGGILTPLVRSTGQVVRYGRQVLENILFRHDVEKIPDTLPPLKSLNKVKKNAGDKERGCADRNHGQTNPSGTAAPVPAGPGVAWSGGIASFLARITSRTLAAEVRRKAALHWGSKTPVVRRAYGQGRPLLAFVGLGMVGGLKRGETVTIEEEGFSTVCGHIKELFGPKKAVLTRPAKDQPDIGCHLTDYVFGPFIAKGCNSVVYSARFKAAALDGKDENKDNPATASFRDSHELTTPPELLLLNENQQEEMDEGEPMSTDHSNSRRNSSNDKSCDGHHDNYQQQMTSVISNYDNDSDITVLTDPGDHDMVSEVDVAWDSMTSSDFTVLDDNDDEYDVLMSESDSESETDEDSEDNEDGDVPLAQYPLAIKMMFNYDAASNASTIYRAMASEAVPALVNRIPDKCTIWDAGGPVRKKRLKHHPNVVDMFGVFVDDVPDMPDGLVEYPDALPERLNPDGYGRNKTMFIVMKRYKVTLRQYLSQNLPTERESTLLFCQLIESLLHINNQNIAHRDIKSDNILLDGDIHCPHLVVTDFGCCLADDSVGLCVPYVTDDVSKGGNGSLMAPEIATARPGRRRYLDYRKSDMWAAGALMYEIFGGDNPFYRTCHQSRLENRTYRSRDLPDMPAHVPGYIKKIARSLLRWKPSRRPEMKTVANALHILLWSPSSWRLRLERKGAPPAKVEVIRWLLTFAAGAMCHNVGQRSLPVGPRHVEYTLQCLFLSRLDFDDVMSAVRYLWTIS